MNRLIIGIVGGSALLVLVGVVVLAAMGKAIPEGILDVAKVSLGGLIGIATSVVAGEKKEDAA